MKSYIISTDDIKAASFTHNGQSPFLFTLKKDDFIIESLIKCAEALQLNGAALSGLGAIEDPVLGNFNAITAMHDPKVFAGLYELTSLNGNIVKRDGQYHVHLHVALSHTNDSDRATISGHLFESKIGLIGEINIFPYV